MFYLKLAVNNIRKSLGIFAPFLLASLVLFSLICSTLLISLSPMSDTMRSGTLTLGLALVVLVIFAIIMEIYSFNFLMKQRSREFGLYNMLGMNKKQVSFIASLELVLLYLAVVVVGTILSGIFANAIYLVFIKLIGYNDLSFAINPLAFIVTAFIFGAIFSLLLLLAMATIGKSSPLVLFRSQEKGEKEPRGNILLALLSLLSLGAGYGLSLTSSYIQSAAILFRFFIAVIFVIIGTYLFYISFMTWYLKTKRRNSSYFYRPENFIRTSQMIFRMKQNAVGLANITLLAIMSFVTIATTTSLYSGMRDLVDTSFPRTTSFTFYGDSPESVRSAYETTVLDPLGKSPDSELAYVKSTIVLPALSGETWQISQAELENPPYPEVAYATLLTQDAARSLGADLPELKEGEVALVTKTNQVVETLAFPDQTFKVAATLSDLHVPSVENMVGGMAIIVKDEPTLVELSQAYFKLGEGAPNPYSYVVFADLTAEEADLISDDHRSFKLADDSITGYMAFRKDMEEDVYGFTGGFLFTGFLLGISFLLGAALIIYYKQYSEGHEDKKSYKILQEVGMSKAAVKKTINSQTIMVFFMPLLMAVIHFVVATVMLRQMLYLFGVSSTSLVYTVSAVTIALVIGVYYLIYKLTSRTYYRIIER